MSRLLISWLGPYALPAVIAVFLAASCALVGYHFYAVSKADSEGFARGVKEERIAWQIEVNNLKTALEVLKNQRQAKIDQISLKFKIQSAVDAAAHSKQLSELGRIIDEIERGNLDEKPGEKSCSIYDKPINSRILRNLNAGR